MNAEKTMTIEEFIYNLDNPQVYTGREINAVRKTPTRDMIHICLVFPDTYEIGMSHYGLKILYHLLNRMPGVSAERCFLPARTSIETFNQHKVPLFSLETRRPLKTFDLIGFSLLTELTYTNILQVLDLAQIPLRWEQRDKSTDSYPVIAAGGISAINPEPLRDFIDIFAVGDGEMLFPEIVAVLSRVKKEKLSRETSLSLFDQVEGIYVPALSPPVKKGRFYIPRVKAGKNGKKRKRSTSTVSASIPDHKIIVPITNTVFNRLTVEIARGCQQNCRFCQAKSYYSPYRAMSVEQTMANIRQGLEQTGFDAFSLSSLSAGDYPCLEPLLQLIPRVITAGTSFSVPSLRPSTLSEDLLSTLALFRRTAITIVPEAGSERLRKVINKNVTDNEIFQAVELALRHNWQKIKLYFMIGLPSETMEDIDGIIRLIQEIKQTASAAHKKINIHASFSSFVPKPHTPLQWAEREDLSSLFAKINYLRKHLKKSRHLDVDIHNPQKGVVETILARGDYRVGELLLKAYEAGEIFTAWDSDFHYHSWKLLIEGTQYEEFLTSIDVHQPLPWDFFDINYKKEFLLKEYEKAAAAVETPSCMDMECRVCGGCYFPGKHKKDTSPGSTDKPTEIPAAESLERAGEIQYEKTRLFYEKRGDFAFFSHLSIMQYVERLIRKSGISFKCTEGFHPRIKMIALPPLPVFAVGLDEVVEVYFDSSLTAGEILARLNRVSEDADFKFKKVEMAAQSRPLSKDILEMCFEIAIPGLRQETGKIQALEQLLTDSDQLSWKESKNGKGAWDVLELSIDYAHQGQERFAKMYKILDPDRKHTRFLSRTQVTFKPLLPAAQ